MVLLWNVALEPPPTSRSNSADDEQQQQQEHCGALPLPHTLNLSIAVAKLACSASGFVLCVDTDGAVYALGANDYGQLGLGDTVHRASPQRVPLSHRVADVAVDWAHSLLLLADSLQQRSTTSASTTADVDFPCNVLSCGWNHEGQLGRRTSGDTDSFEMHFAPPRFSGCVKVHVAAVAAGHAHSVFLDGSNGTLFTCGSNDHGQLGRLVASDDADPNSSRFVAAPVTSVSPLLSALPRFSAIACGALHTLAASANSLVTFSCGWNSYTQLGHHDSTADEPMLRRIRELDGWSITQLAAGVWHSAAIARLPPSAQQQQPQYELFTWGWGKHGALAHGDSASAATPQRVRDRRAFTSSSSPHGSAGDAVLLPATPPRVHCGAQHTLLFQPASQELFIAGRCFAPETDEGTLLRFSRVLCDVRNVATAAEGWLVVVDRENG